MIINSPDPVTHTCATPCNIADARDASLFPAGMPLSTVLNIATTRTGFGGSISVFYQFKLRGENHFSFAWHNTTGALREGCALPNNVPGTNPPQPSQPGQAANGCFGPAVGRALPDPDTRVPVVPVLWTAAHIVPRPMTTSPATIARVCPESGGARSPIMRRGRLRKASRAHPRRSADASREDRGRRPPPSRTSWE